MSMLVPENRKSEAFKLQMPDEVLIHALKSINECVSITDKENRILFVNEAFLKTYGYVSEELVGRDIAIVLSSRNPYKNKEIVPATLTGGWAGEVINRKKDGTEFPIFLSTSVVKNDHGDPIAMIGVATDIGAKKIAELEEQQSALRFRNIVEGTKAVLFNTSSRGIITYANEAAYKALGCMPGTLEGKNYLEFVHPADRKRVHDTYRRQILGETKSTCVEFRFVDSWGHTGWFEFLADWLVQDGNVVGMSGVGQIITDRKRAELALQESEEVYRTLVGTSPDAITGTDVLGRITFASPKARELFGCAPEQNLIGRSIFDWVAPEERERAATSLQKILTTGNLVDHEFILLGRNGEQFNGEVNAAIVRSGEGSPEGIIITTRDVTERKRSEEALQMFRSSIDQASDAIFWLDRDARITYVNEEACRSLGYSREELLQMPLWTIDPQYPRELWEQRWRQHEEHREGGTERVETIHQRKDGSMFQVEVVSEHIWFGSKPLHVAYVRNIEERKQAEAALRASEGQLSNAAKIAQLGPWEYDVIKDQFTFNDHFYRLLHTTAEAEGGYTMSSAQYSDRFVHPEERSVVGREIQKAIEADDPQFSQQLEHRIVFADGGIGHVVVRFFVIKSESGKTLKTYGVNQDITEVRKASEAMRLSEEKFSKAFRTNPDSININRLRDGLYLEINHGFTAMTGYTEDDVFGKSSLELNIWANPEDRAKLLEGLKRDGEVVNLEAKFRTKSGTLVSGLMSAAIIEVGGEECIISITRDISDRKAAEEMLKRSLAWQEAIFEGSRDAIFLTDTNARFISANAAACELTGYSKSELLDMSIPDLHENMDLEAFRTYHARIMGGEETLTEAKILRNDGTKVDTEFSNRRIIVGGVPYMHTAARDVTARKLVDEGLAKLNDCLLSFGPDPLQNIDRLTALCGELLHADSALYNRLDEGMLCSWGRWHIPNGYDPKDKPEGHICYDVIQRGGEDIFVFRNLLESRYAQSDPNVLAYKLNTYVGKAVKFEERYVGSLCTVYQRDFVPSEAEKRLIGILASAIAVEEKRRWAEQALKESEDQYRQFFEQDLTGDFITTVDGEIIECNPAFARIFGFAGVEEAKHTNVQRLYPSPEHREELLNVLRERKKLENYEFEGRRIDGTILYLIENLIGIFNEQGGLTHIKAYVFDNTERKNLEQQLLQAQKMESIGTLASGIAHDFNNVLNNIIGFAQQIKKYPGDHDRIARYSETIEKSAFRGADLAKRLVMFGRKRARQNELTEIGGIVDDILQLTNETFPKSIAVQKDLDSSLNCVLVDRGELYQALLNCCLNSRDALLERENPGSASSIIIRARNRDTSDKLVPEVFKRQNENVTNCVEISVSDNGAGIPADVIGKIFDPFFTTKERGKGTGLGLAVVYNIAKNAGGAVTVESSVGNGTTMHIFLPASSRKKAAADHSPSEKLNAESKGVVLLVDDDELMRELGTELLRDGGYQAITARDGTEAISTYRKQWEEISLVILDVAMPGMDGGEVYTHLKKINPKVRAFFCTGFVSDNAISPMLERREVRALEKPFNPVDFRKMVREVLST